MRRLGQERAEPIEVPVQLLDGLRLHLRVVLGDAAGVVEEIRDVVEPHLLELLRGRGAVHGLDQRAHVLGVLAEGGVGRLREIAVVTQSSTRQPHGEDRVLAEVLLELSAQIDR